MGARRFPGFSPLRYTTLTALGGTLSIVAIAQALTWGGALDAPAAGDFVAIWWRVLYVAGPAAALAVLAWNDGVHRLGAPNGALFINLVPVVTFAIAVVQGYRPGGVELAGAGLTVAALVGANLVGRRARSGQDRGRRAPRGRRSPRSHARRPPADRGPGPHRPSSRTPSSSAPRWWASSWRTVRVTCPRSSSGSSPKSRSSVSRKMTMRSGWSSRATVSPW